MSAIQHNSQPAKNGQFINELIMSQEIVEDTITVTVNGEQQQLAAGATVADLVATMDLQGRRVAVECNLEIVPKTEHATTLLKTGDVLEIVHAIGGG